MADRLELLEAAIDSRSEGVTILDSDGKVLYWNCAAEAISGFLRIELVNQTTPSWLDPLVSNSEMQEARGFRSRPVAARGASVSLVHKLGHTFQVIARRVTLRNELGEKIGVSIVFHPAETRDALPQGEASDDQSCEASQTELTDRYTSEFGDADRSNLPFGVLWISIDQAKDFRKSHGMAAEKAMLDKVSRALAQGLRPGESIGQWGAAEYLILAHERNEQMLLAHAQRIAGLARTADLQWWGDRVSLTVSIGAAQLAPGSSETEAHLLERAQLAMEESAQAGGNRATLAASYTAAPESSNQAQATGNEPGNSRGGSTCLPS